jgi:hypothetical protein
MTYRRFINRLMISGSILRTDLAEAQNWRCAYCSVEMVLDPEAWDGATREHLTARRFGGEDCWSNLVAACRACNDERGSDHSAESYYCLVQSRKRVMRITGSKQRPKPPPSKKRANELLVSTWVQRSLARRRRFFDMAHGRAKIIPIPPTARPSQVGHPS